MQRNIVITGGHVIDPANGVDEIRDVHIEAGKIVDRTEAELTIDASGKYVFPGLIDYHAHVFPGSTEIGIDADASMLHQGVTGVVDPGSAGVANMETFIRDAARRSTMNVRAYINLCPAGLATMRYHEDYNPKFWDAPRLARFLEAYPDILLGLKIRISRGILGEPGFGVVERAVELAESLHTRLCVHTTDPVGGMAAVASILRRGDILAHCYHGTGSSIIGENGRVLPEVRAARERGVIMDAANGGNHWSFETARAALADGFPPDIISTDLTCKTLYRDPVFSLPYVMSKYLLLGMELAEIVRAATVAPARAMRRPDAPDNGMGTLSFGATADVAVFALAERETRFTDTQKRVATGRQMLVPLMTIRAGEIAYINMLF